MLLLPYKVRITDSDKLVDVGGGEDLAQTYSKLEWIARETHDLCKYGRRKAKHRSITIRNASGEQSMQSRQLVANIKVLCNNSPYEFHGLDKWNDHHIHEMPRCFDNKWHNIVGTYFPRTLKNMLMYILRDAEDGKGRFPLPDNKHYEWDNNNFTEVETYISYCRAQFWGVLSDSLEKYAEDGTGEWCVREAQDTLEQAELIPKFLGELQGRAEYIEVRSKSGQHPYMFPHCKDADPLG